MTQRHISQEDHAHTAPNMPLTCAIPRTLGAGAISQVPDGEIQTCQDDVPTYNSFGSLYRAESEIKIQ